MPTMYNRNLLRCSLRSERQIIRSLNELLVVDNFLT